MLLLKLAMRNLIGAGLRTWLNVFVLSLAFVMIIWMQGLVDGMARYAMNTRIDYEIGGGQFWHRAYDPYDPFTYEDSHAPPSAELDELIIRGEATPILVSSCAIYPDGRVQSAALKGIDPEQGILRLPTEHLAGGHDGAIPAMIGSQLAKQTKLRVGDYVTVRWRDVNGTFDADDILIVRIISTTVPSIDQGVIWVPIGKLREMLRVPGEASLVVLRRGIEALPPENETWIHHDPDFLLSDLIEMIKMKSGTSYILYGLLLFMGLIAIFDTQILSIWRRRREIGTLMALGMERLKVIGLFTVEGGLHGLLALGVGAVYGIPLLTLTYQKGIPLPSMMSDFGFAIPQTLYPAYGIRLVIATTLLVLISVTIVSYLPASKISKLKPTEALRGKGS